MTTSAQFPSYPSTFRIPCMISVLPDGAGFRASVGGTSATASTEIKARNALSNVVQHMVGQGLETPMLIQHDANAMTMIYPELGGWRGAILHRMRATPLARKFDTRSDAIDHVFWLYGNGTIINVEV